MVDAGADNPNESAFQIDFNIADRYSAAFAKFREVFGPLIGDIHQRLAEVPASTLAEQ